MCVCGILFCCGGLFGFIVGFFVGFVYLIVFKQTNI